MLVDLNILSLGKILPYLSILFELKHRHCPIVELIFIFKIVESVTLTQAVQ